MIEYDQFKVERVLTMVTSSEFCTWGSKETRIIAKTGYLD